VPPLSTRIRAAAAEKTCAFIRALVLLPTRPPALRMLAQLLAHALTHEHNIREGSTTQGIAGDERRGAGTLIMYLGFY